MAFREKTTFVIGAGASAEFGLPVGSGLAAEIKKTAMFESDDRDNPSHGLLRELLYTKCKVGAEESAAKKPSTTSTKAYKLPSVSTHSFIDTEQTRTSHIGARFLLHWRS